MKFKLLFLASLLVLFITGCTDVATSSVNVTEGLVTMNPGETYALDVTVDGEAGTYVQFQSKDPNVVTVDSTGLMTAVGAGETLITITAGVGTDYVFVRVLGEAAVAFDAGDFMSSYDAGAYRIELRGDVSLTDDLEIDRPIEIVFNGYTLTGNLKVINDFEGGIALNNEQPLETLLTLTEADTFVLNGTLDMGGFLIPVYSNYVSLYTQDTYDFIITNYYDVDGYNYTVNYEYQNIGDAIPIASIDDLQNISTDAPYVFAQGTPYERAVLNASQHTNYVLVNDIQGESTRIDTYVVVVGDDGQFYIFNELETGLWDSYIDENDIDFLLRYRRSNMMESYDDDFTEDNLPTNVKDYLVAQSITMSYAYRINEYDFEYVPEEDIDFSNFVLDGRDHFIKNWELDRYDELFDYASGQVELHNITFSYLMGSTDDSNTEGLIFGEIEAQTVVFKNLVIEYSYYEIESDDSNNYGLLVGLLEQADDFTMVNVYVYSNKMYAEYSGDTGFLFGEMNRTNGFVRNVTMNRNVTVQDGSDDDFGFFAGFIDNSNLDVSEYESIENKVISDGDDSGLFVGTMDSTTISFTDSWFNYDYFEGEDNIAAVMGDLYNSFVIISDVEVRYTSIIGLNNIAGLIGEIDNSKVDINYVIVDTVTIEGTYKLSTIVGEINTESSVEIQYTEVFDSNIIGSDYEMGGMVGKVDGSYLKLTNNLVQNLSITMEEGSLIYKIGGLIGQASESVLDLIRNDVRYSTLSGDYEIGGLIGNQADSTSRISNNIVNNVTVIGNESVGAYLGYASGSLDIRDSFIRNSTVTGVLYDGAVIGVAENLYVDLINQFIELLNTLTTDGFYDGIAGYVFNSTFNIR